MSTYVFKYIPLLFRDMKKEKTPFFLKLEIFMKNHITFHKNNAKFSVP